MELVDGSRKVKNKLQQDLRIHKKTTKFHFQNTKIYVSKNNNNL